MIRYLSDEHHERLWRICDALVSGSGARSALLCDEANGAIIVSVGDASASGSVSGVQRLSAQEFAVEGEGGQIYGINIPGGAMLIVLHDPGALERVRAAAADAVHDVAELLASLPPPPPAPDHDHTHSHQHATATGTQRRAAKSKPAPKQPAKAKRASGAKPKARSKSTKAKKRRR